MPFFMSGSSDHIPRRQSGPRPSPVRLLPRAHVKTILQLYDYPHPRKPHTLIRGYDKTHALRTATMSAAVARDLSHEPSRLRPFYIACLLHDLGRAGLDHRLFGRIWSWARRHDIPTRPAEWRARHPRVRDGGEARAFVKAHGQQLADDGIPLTGWACEQIDMRLDFARRHRRQLKQARPTLASLDIRWLPWMEHVTLSYYYPEKLAKSPGWVRELGEILIACEQLEAHSNRRRGKDYYTRARESFAEAFAYLDSLRRQKRLSSRVVNAVRRLTASGVFDPVLKAARGGGFSPRERRFLRSL